MNSEHATDTYRRYSHTSTIITKPFQYATTIRDFIDISPFRAVIVVNICLTTDADAVFHEGIGRRFCPPIVPVR